MTDHLLHPAADPAPLALRPRQAAAALNISARTLWTLTRRGEVPCVRVGRAVLYGVDDLRRWLAKQATTATKATEGGAL
jgi:excisionase family DNA binding protein